MKGTPTPNTKTTKETREVPSAELNRLSLDLKVPPIQSAIEDRLAALKREAEYKAAARVQQARAEILGSAAQEIPANTSILRTALAAQTNGRFELDTDLLAVRKAREALLTEAQDKATTKAGEAREEIAAAKAAVPAARAENPPMTGGATATAGGATATAGGATATANAPAKAEAVPIAAGTTSSGIFGFFATASTAAITAITTAATAATNVLSWKQPAAGIIPADAAKAASVTVTAPIEAAAGGAIAATETVPAATARNMPENPPMTGGAVADAAAGTGTTPKTAIPTVKKWATVSTGNYPKR